MAMVFKIASMPAFSLIPLLVRSHFGGDAAQLSFMQALFGVGVVIGGLVLSVWGGFQRKIHTMLTGIIVFSFTFVGLGLAPGDLFSIALASTFVMGLVIPMIDGPIMAIMQSTVAPELQGRVFTLMGSMLNLVAPLSLAVAGPISDRLGIQVWYLLTAAISFVMGIAGFFIPAIIHIEENGHTSPETQADFVAAD
jgi:DHA3 family macrolide efflux protein-like MFS transporter